MGLFPLMRINGPSETHENANRAGRPQRGGIPSAPIWAAHSGLLGNPGCPHGRLNFFSDRPGGLSRQPARGLASHTRQALLLETSLDALAGEPLDRLRLRCLAANRLRPRDPQQKADVVVLVGWLASPGGDQMNVEIEDLRTGSDWHRLEIGQSGLLLGLAQGSSQHIGLTVRVAPDLQPAVELSMMSEQHSPVLAGHDPG